MDPNHFILVRKDYIGKDITKKVVGEMPPGISPTTKKLANENADNEANGKNNNGKEHNFATKVCLEQF